MFLHYLINGTIFGKKLLNIKCMFWFSPQILSEIFLILRRIQGRVIINVHWSSCKEPVILVRFWWNLNVLDRLKKTKLTSLFEGQGFTELSVIFGIRGRQRKPIRQPSGLIPIRQNEPRKAESMVKKTVTKGRNPEHRVSRHIKTVQY